MVWFLYAANGFHLVITGQLALHALIDHIYNWPIKVGVVGVLTSSVLAQLACLNPHNDIAFSG